MLCMLRRKKKLKFTYNYVTFHILLFHKENYTLLPPSFLPYINLTKTPASRLRKPRDTLYTKY